MVPVFVSQFELATDFVPGNIEASGEGESASATGANNARKVNANAGTTDLDSVAMNLPHLVVALHLVIFMGRW